MSEDILAKRYGLTARQIRYWRKKGYVPAKKLGRAWVYDLDAHRRFEMIARLLKAGASPQAALEAVGAIESEAPRRLRADASELRLYVVGGEVLVVDGEVMFNPVSRTLVHPILVSDIYSTAESKEARHQRSRGQGSRDRVRGIARVSAEAPEGVRGRGGTVPRPRRRPRCRTKGEAGFHLSRQGHGEARMDSARRRHPRRSDGCVLRDVEHGRREADVRPRSEENGRR